MKQITLFLCVFLSAALSASAQDSFRVDGFDPKKISIEILGDKSGVLATLEEIFIQAQVPQACSLTGACSYLASPSIKLTAPKDKTGKDPYRFNLTMDRDQPFRISDRVVRKEMVFGGQACQELSGWLAKAGKPGGQSGITAAVPKGGRLECSFRF